jgi:hypothetical protein
MTSRRVAVEDLLQEKVRGDDRAQVPLASAVSYLLAELADELCGYRFWGMVLDKSKRLRDSHGGCLLSVMGWVHSHHGRRQLRILPCAAANVIALRP